MPDLIALDLPGGDDFVSALQRAWDDGNAVFPVDQRLPQAAKEALLDQMAPGVIVSSSGTVRRDQARPTEAGDAVVVATSGTGGRPKGAVLTHSAVAASAEITSAGMGVEAATDTWLACLPLAHIGGLTVITRALHTGTGLVVHPHFDAEACEAAARQGCTLVSLVVTALARIDAGLFRRILLGGDAIPSERPPNTLATYGMTETGSGVVYDGHPLDRVELKVVESEIHVRSPTLLRCYRDGTNPLSTDGWFPTGDAGALGVDGVLQVRGRMSDVIVSGGEKVWPVIVERELDKVSWVSEAAVVGRPDPEWGHVVTAVVATADDIDPPTLEALRDELRDALPGYALPRAIELVDALPRTNLGKVERRSL